MIPATLRLQHAQGTTPCTIAQAISICKGQQQQQQRQQQRSSSTAPIDLVAIVVDVTLSPFQQSLVWIQDGSFDDDDDDNDDEHDNDSPPRALFSFSNSAIVQEHRVSIGDVVRFNRVALKGSRKHNLHSDNKNLFEGSCVLYCFHHPWSDPEAGPEWFCLGHVDGTSGEFQPTQAILPDSMQTDSSYLQRLYHWYLTSSYFQARQTTTPMLSPLPCQLRSISDLLHSCVGVISHVHARVLDLQHVRPGSSVVFALLTDTATTATTTTTSGQCSVFTSESAISGSMTSPDTILFRDDSGLFRDTLELAHVTQQVLRLTNVMAKRAPSGVRFSAGIKGKGRYLNKHKSKLQLAAIQGNKQDQPDIVLLPTAKTCVTIISPNERAGSKKNCFSHVHELSLPNQLAGTTWPTQSNPMLPSKPVTVAHAFVRCLSFQSSDANEKVVALTKENVATTCISRSGQCDVDYALEPVASLSRLLENYAASRACNVFHFELQRVEPTTKPSDADTRVQASISVHSFLYLHLGCNSDELHQSPQLRQIVLRVLVGMIWDQSILCWTLELENDDCLLHNQGGLTGQSGTRDNVVITHVSLARL